MEVAIIGIDCATVAARVGLAFGMFTTQQLVLKDARVAGSQEAMLDQLVDWMDEQHKTLIALDAPLGWPEPLGRLLAEHEAGEPLKEEANRLFRRQTDRFVKEKLGKLPLDVGADRIARTAQIALAILASLRARTGELIPLLWDTEFAVRTGAIEVYPAGTLSAAGIRSTGYKEREKNVERREIAAWLATEMAGVGEQHLLIENADVLDAAICLVAGKDFLLGRAMAPTSPRLAKKEGWIWVREKHR